MESMNYHPSLVNRVGQRVIPFIARALYRNLTKIKISGMENIPQKGPYLIAFNHTSIYEPPFLVAMWPMPPIPLGAVEVWKEPDKLLFAYLYGGIPIDRDQYDRAAMERVVAALRNGYSILIAPEGRLSRQPGMKRAKLGISYFVERTRARVVPVGIVGCTPDFLIRVLKLKKPKVEMHIGAPFELPPIGDLPLARKDAYQQNADYVLARVAALLPVEYRGYYLDYERIILTHSSWVPS